LDLLCGAKNGVYAFGYITVESELIYMKCGAIGVHCLEPALADFGRDLSISDDLGASQNFAFVLVT